MIRTEVFVSNTRVELSKDISAEFTYNIDDVKDFASRNTSFSKTIILPGNANNNKLFGHIFEFGSANFYDSAQPNVGYNFNAAVSAPCVIYVDKIQIFKGIIRLLEIVIDNGTIEYECAVFGELGGFVSKLGNSRIEDLDFSAYDHAWTITNIQNSWDNVSGSGYYYPLIDYGNCSTVTLFPTTAKHDWDVKAFRPALFVREYMNKIITGAGYTYDASFFDSVVFRRLIIPQNGKNLLKTSSNPLQASLTNTKTMLTSMGVNIKNLNWDSTVLANMTEDAQKTMFTYTGATTINVTIDLQIFGYLQSYQPVYIKLYKNGTVIYTNAQTSGLGAFSRPYNLITQLTTTLAQNDVLKVEYSTTTSSNPTFLVDARNGTFKVTTDSAQVVPANYGDAIDINANIPKGIFQRDFFSSIIKMFNLYVVEDTQLSNHLIIKPYIDFYDTGISLLEINDFDNLLKVNDDDFLLLQDGNINFIEWTYKVDRAKPIRLKPMSELNGRYFEYKYKPDADYYNENYQKKWSQGYADRIEDTGYEFAKEKQTAELIFAATPLVGYTGEDKIYPTIFKLTDQSGTKIEDTIEHVCRIMQAKKVSGVNSFAIKNGATTLASVTTYGYGGHLDDPDVPQADINFGAPNELFITLATNYPSANLFNSYWSDYIAEITDKDSKVLSCYVRLRETDIFSLDFSKLIYIDGSLWRLNKVEDYNPMTNDATKCEFLKVIELTYD